MKFSHTLLSALLLPPLSTASSAPTTSPALMVQATIIRQISATTPPSRRDDKFAPSIPPLSLDLPTISIAKPSIASFSLNLPPNTCTPGFSSYATPGVDGYVPAEACNALWVYFPSFATAVAFSILFGILTILHLGQAIRYHNGFCWVIIMASSWETGAYAFRALGSKNQQSSGMATVAQILVLVAPICECQAERQLSLLSLTSSSRGQRLRIYGFRPHRSLLLAYSQSLALLALCPRARFRQSRHCCLRDSTRRRWDGRPRFKCGFTKEGLEHIYGRYWHAGRLYCSVPRLGRQISPGSAPGRKSRTRDGRQDCRLEMVNLFSLRMFASHYCSHHLPPCRVLRRVGRKQSSPE